MYAPSPGYRLLAWLLAPLLLGAAFCLAPFVPKLRASLYGRLGLHKRLRRAMAARVPGRPLVWLHAASAGELLQGFGVLQRLLAAGAQGLVSVSSPAGLEWARKRLPPVDASLLLVDYSPLDTPWDLRRAFRCARPALLAYVKWDVWPNMAWQARRAGVRQVLIGAALARESSRLRSRPRRALMRQIHGALEAIYTTSAANSQRFRRITPPGVPIRMLGDLRFDSTAERLAALPLPALPPGFAPGGWTVVAGSVWPADAQHLLPALEEALAGDASLRAIWVPHEIDPAALHAAQERLGRFGVLRLSAWAAQAGRPASRQAPPPPRVLLVDSVGQLAALYRFGRLAFVGGGFGVGVHNVLEATAAGAVCVFGPNSTMDPQAESLVRQGLGLRVRNTAETRQAILGLLASAQALADKTQRLQAWMHKGQGAAAACASQLKTLAGLA